MNREISSCLWPLSGDVFTQAGDVNVRVTGILGFPVKSDTSNGGEQLLFNGTDGAIHMRTIQGVMVNLGLVSDDEQIAINVAKEILVNGA